MQVEVRLFARFREGRFKDRLMDLPDGTTVADLLSQLDIPAEKTNLRLINGKQSALDRALADGDVAVLVDVGAAYAAVAGRRAYARWVIVAGGSTDRTSRTQLICTAARRAVAAVLEHEAGTGAALSVTCARGAPTDVFGDADLAPLATDDLSPLARPPVRAGVATGLGADSAAIDSQHTPAAIALRVLLACTPDGAFALVGVQEVEHRIRIRLGDVRRGVCIGIRRRVCTGVHSSCVQRRGLVHRITREGRDIMYAHLARGVRGRWCSVVPAAGGDHESCENDGQ